MLNDKSQELEKLLADLRTMLEAGNKFVLEQSPPLAREIVAYGRVMHPVWILVGLLLLFSAYKISPKVRQAWITMDSELWGLGGMLYSIVGGVIGAALTLFNLEDAIKAWFAPRLYLLEYIASLLK